MSHTAASRILVISSTLDQAQDFVERIKDISHSRSGINSSNGPLTSSSDIGQNASDTSGNEVALTEGSLSIPWTIVNKYYTADVHFETRLLREVRGHHVEGVPAVVYVFSTGEKYRDHASNLARTIELHSDNIEVTLAVRISDTSAQADGTVVAKPAVDEEEGLDEFLLGHNFEFVDGDRGGRKPTGDGGGFDDEDEAGIPGLPRVLDALSTIMWPTLVQAGPSRSRKSRAMELLDWAREEEEDDGLKALVSPPYNPDDHVEESSSQTRTTQEPHHKKSRMQREMDELQKWLEEEDHALTHRHKQDDHEAWTHADWTDMPTTPTINAPFGAEDLGFEDDFTDFVGAPVEVHYGGTGAPKAERLIPMRTGASYQSLASFDDHSFSASHTSVADTEDDDELPSRNEIEETSRRIFGHIPSPLSTLQVPPQPRSSRNLDSPANFPTSLPSPASQPHDIPFDTPDSSFAPDDDDDDEYEMGAFDLSRVLSALQGMKEEISSMGDEDERRKAAARVALGLVYGLQKEEERSSGQASAGNA
ncbi:hypothetical protein EIP91_001115 [Steccherinum ochraceum]|uniref:Uncharacterized protein n=1 Tax=Steccherinum ochraceum TaxID=92696 RepID=A0A4R0RGY4_9APHY|nr:hypothetical protein EIP91_001115 [Steccherinum ochraceum]